jgi:Glycogen recognition site of AMP-activated protein kinase
VRDEHEVSIDRIARELQTPVRIHGSFDARVMETVRRLPRHSRFGLWSRLTTPRSVMVTPLSWGLLAATVAMVAVLGATHVSGVGNRSANPASGLVSNSGNAEAQRIQFVLVAPDAKKVAVVGDFNGWDASHAGYQAQHRGGGVWSVTAAVPLGHHRYSFVVDDSLWMPDPTAPRATDNDFGVTNSAIVVSAQE